MEAYQLDKQRVADSFNRARDSYDKVSVVQCEIGERMLNRLDFIKLEPSVILDLGASTGYFSDLLQKRFQKSSVISLDIADQLLLQAKNNKAQLICADAEYIPLSNNSVDFVFSNFLLHWCPNIEQAFKEVQRTLKPDGLFLFSMPGPDTLYELREAWEAVDDKIHVNAFYEAQDIAEALMRAKFIDPVMDVDNLTVAYEDPMKLMREIKLLGARNVTAGREKGLTTKAKLQKVFDAYKKFKLEDGLLPVTYEVIYGHAWGRDIANLKGIAIHAD